MRFTFVHWIHMDVQSNSTSDVFHKSKYLTKESPFWVHKGPLRPLLPPKKKTSFMHGKRA